MIKNYLLQLDYSSIYNGFQSFSSSPVIQQYSQVLFPLVVLIGFGILGFFGLRVLKNKLNYAGDGRPLSKFIFDVQDEFRFKGNVSERENPFSQDVINELKLMDDENIVKFANELEQYVKKVPIYSYDIKFTDRDEDWSSLRTDNDGVIISPVPIDDRQYHSYDKKGERSITSLVNKEHARVVLCHKDTFRIKSLKIPDEGEKEVWIISVFPKDSVPFGLPDETGKLMNCLEVKVLPDMMNLAEAVLAIRVLANLYKTIRVTKLENDKLYEQIENKDKYIQKKQTEQDLLRYKLQQHKLIGEEDHPRLPPREESIMWFMAGGIFGLIGWNIPTYITPLSNMPPVLGAMIGLGIGAVIRYYVKKKEQEPIADLEKKAQEGGQ